LKPQLRGAITQSTVTESTTEISLLEGTSPRETASTSAYRVPNTLIADYGREKKIEIMWKYMAEPGRPQMTI